MSELEWIATVIGEYGGPMIVCSEADYLRWSGSFPLPLEQRRVLHYWGQFTAKLPAPYAQDGGHVFREHPTREALARDFEALLAAIREKWPKATIERDDEVGSASVAISLGRRMTIQQAPMSAYDRACDALEEVGVQSFATQGGLEASAVFWEKEGGGLVDIAITADRRELVLLRTWVNDEADEQTARTFVAQTAPDSEELRLDLTRRVVVAYSPHTWLTMLPKAAFERASAAPDRAAGRTILEESFRALVGDVSSEPKLLDGPEDRDVACVLELEPGTYRVSAGSHEEDEWSAIWCRLRRS